MGFKREQFVEEVDENLFCGICLEVLEDPWQCKDGHSFCKDCITKSLVIRRKCPMCKSVLPVSGLGRCLGMKNMIENLKVYCHPPESDRQEVARMDVTEESKLKCDWTGKLQSLAKHRETCPFQQVQCPNVNCNTNMQRRELEDHDKICEYKLLECDEQCGVTLIRRDLPNHKSNDCPEVTLLCPNLCWKNVKRKDITTHRETCPCKQVLCPNGCNNKMWRRMLKRHDKICTYKVVECDEECGVTLIRRDLPNHKRNDCPQKTLPCPNDCGKSIKRMNITTHRETCPFQQVKCSNMNCNTNMQRRKLKDHDKICRYKVVKCKKCRKVLVRRQLQEHDCPEELVPCPNMCKSQETGQINKIRRIDVNNHLKNDCANTKLDCPFKDQGCSVQVERRHVDKHVQDDMAAHVLLLAKENSSLKKQLKQNFVSLTEENRLLKEEVQKNDELSRTYTWRIKNYRDYYPKKSNRRYSADEYDTIVLRSPTFWLCGFNWVLKLYPNGNDMINRGFVSVALHMMNSYGTGKSSKAAYSSSTNEIQTSTTVFVTCRLSVISQKPEFPNVTSKTMEELPTNSERNFVIQRFYLMKADEAISEAYCNSTNGSLTIQCTIQLDK